MYLSYTILIIFEYLDMCVDNRIGYVSAS